MALVQRTTTAGAVAREHGLTESSVRRHAANHLPKMLATLAHRVDALEADVILAQLVHLYERGLEALSDAESMSQDSDRAKAVPALIREGRANLEALAKVSIALSDARSTQTVSVENTLQAEISEALAELRHEQGKGAGDNSATQTPSPAQVALAPGEAIDDAEIVS